MALYKLPITVLILFLSMIIPTIVCTKLTFSNILTKEKSGNREILIQHFMLNSCLIDEMANIDSTVHLLSISFYKSLFLCSYSDGDLTLIYPDGTRCSTGFQRMTIINFECNKNACKTEHRTFPLFLTQLFFAPWHHLVVISVTTQWKIASLDAPKRCTHNLYHT